MAAFQSPRDAPAHLTHSANSATDLRAVIRSAFVQTHDGWSADEVILNVGLNRVFIDRCHQQAPEVDAAELNWALLNLRKAGLLKVKTTRFNRKSIKPSMAVAEVVARSIVDQHKTSIDRIMTSPALRSSFDAATLAIAPGADTYAVGKAALSLRKQRRLKPELIARIADWGRQIHTVSLDALRSAPKLVPELPGVYIFRDATGYLYIGQSENLQQRLREHLSASSNFSLANYLADESHDNISIEVHAFSRDSQAQQTMVRRAYESELIASRKPKFNIQP